MDEFIHKVKAFIERVKDDPNLSELFRIAANELHDQLNPSSPDTPTEPATPADPVEPDPNAVPPEG